MISDEQLTEAAYLISARFEAVNSLYIQKMAEQIKEIGKLGPANLSRLNQMLKMQQNVEEINKQLSKACNLSLQEIYDIYDASGLSVYEDASKYYGAKGIKQVPFANNVWIQQYIEAIKKNTENTLINISRTTAIRDDYINLVDTAISAVTTGVTDYNSIIRSQLTYLSMQGMSIEYASGYKRRIDSAMRMNILEGIRQVNNAVREQTGKEFGADGVEISVHALCAPDHIEVQGKQYSNKQFEELQGRLKRRISTCNCHHITFPIILGVSEPVHSEEQLQQYKNNSEQEVEITTGYTKGKDEEGNDILIPKRKKVTKYEATQYQRNIETEIRKAKDLKIAGDASGDSVLVDEAKQRIKALQSRYKLLSDEAGLTPKWDRTYVPGYNGKQVVPKSITLKPQVTITNKDNISIQQSNYIVNKAIFERYNHRINDLGVNFVSYEDLNKFISDSKLGADFTGMDERLANATANQLVNLSNQYETMLTKVNVDKLDITSAPAGTDLSMNIAQATLTFNKDVVKDYNKFIERMDKAVEKGQFPKIPKSQYEKYVITHEFAHTLLETEGTLKNYVNAPTANIQKARKEIKELRQNYEEHLRKLDAEWKELELKSLETFDIDIWDRAVKLKEEIDSITISKYASMNADEFMAEAFVDAMLSDNPSKYSIKVKAIIDKYFKK